MDVREAFGANVRRLREQLGVSQEELADRAELDRTYISSIERGKYNVSLVTICRLALVLGCEPYELLEGLKLTELASVKRQGKKR